MDQETSYSETSPWGVTRFDEAYGGLPKRQFNLLQTCNKEVTLAALCHFIKAGMELEHPVVVVGFEHPRQVFYGATQYHFDLEAALASEQLIYLYYKPIFSFSLNFATNYRQLLDEIRCLAKTKTARIAFLNAEALFNLETRFLAETSAEKIMADFSDERFLILGCIQNTPGNTDPCLKQICHTSLHSVMEIRPAQRDASRKYELIAHKNPLRAPQPPIRLRMHRTSGFNTPNLELISHG